MWDCVDLYNAKLVAYGVMVDLVSKKGFSYFFKTNRIMFYSCLILLKYDGSKRQDDAVIIDAFISSCRGSML